MILALLGLALADPVALYAPGAPAAPPLRRAPAPAAESGADAGGDALGAAVPGGVPAPSTLGVVVAASGNGVSAAAWLPGGGLGMAVEGDLGGGPIGASVAIRRAARGPRGFGVELVGAAGLASPTAAPAALVTITPGASIGWRTRRVDATLGLVAPLAARLTPDPALTLPVRLEPWLGIHLGPASVGLGAGLGYVWTTDALWALDVRGSFSLGFRR